MSKSTIEIKTAFEGCAEYCKWYMPECTEVHMADCENRFLCEEIAERIRTEQTADNPLDEMFADSFDKLDGLDGRK